MPDANPSGAASLLSQLRELWARQPKRRRTLACVLVLVLVLAIVLARSLHGETSWGVVADGANADDARELVATLSARGIRARERDGRIEVATERLADARAIAAAAGLPRSGNGFELFDRSSLGQSSFTEQVNYRRALQGELARSITALAQVQGARVHIAFGKRSVFKDQQEPASGSVALHLHPRQTLAAEQVRGIRQLVAASVEGLEPEAVVIVDNHGNLLDAADPDLVDRQAEIERTVTARVRTLLERVVGVGRVSVVTTAVVDDRKVSETQELYDHANPALRSESRTSQSSDAIAGIGGIAGTRGNLPGAPGPAPAPAGSDGGPRST